MSRIVVGVDGSQDSRAALRWAAAEARLHGASLHLVRAFQLTDPGLLTDTGGWMPPLSEFQAGAERLAEQIVTEEKVRDGGVEVRVEGVHGGAASALVRAAEGADMLVVGSRGHGGLAGMLLGSVSKACTEHSPCTVVVVR
jgi:nucleotide-binding universal stress UspA family protein